MEPFIQWLATLPVLWQALLMGLFTWAVTAAGAATIFFFRGVNQKLLDAMLGFAAGVMIAASFFSLLAPAVEMAEQMGQQPWLTVGLGFTLGGIAIALLDRFLPHLHPGLSPEHAEGVKTRWQKSVLLVLAITLHNIPEGLAVGVSIGGAAAVGTKAALIGAVALAIGIGIQDFPEGVAVSFPLRREGLSKWRSFFYGQLSGVVEPIGAVVGALLVYHVAALLPFALAFSAAAMIYVCVEELIPESHLGGNTDLATYFTLLGFLVMMTLDIALG